MEAGSTIDKANTMFQLALALVNQSTRNIFLTGKAGTGKTTFLRYIRANCAKQIVVVAPTGVAAINAGGVTIHSLFQLPFGPYIPATSQPFSRSSPEEITNASMLIDRLKMTREKIRVLEELELLVIDEISMVRADTLDAIDTVLRHVRKRPLEKFGGVQVLFIGDMFQLPPVTREDVWQWLSEYYNSPYFFDSHVLRDDLPVYVEFNKVYRQNEERFISLLNQVRNDELDEDGFEILESRYLPSFERNAHDGYIMLTTHNEIVRKINTDELQKLTAERYYFNAEVTGEFPGTSFPADETLVLCEGAQVMFIRNDAAERGKRFFNGKIGFVSKVERDKIWVQCGEEEEIEVKKDKWDNIRYSVNPANRLLEEETLGSFSQYPLRLAWAITIHKSQGLTFEKAIIDAGKAFAPGQVYVALSRCTDLEGLVLKSRINSSSLRNDPRIAEFARNSASAEALKGELREASLAARVELILEVFDFRRESELVALLDGFIRKHESSFRDESISWIDRASQLIASLRETGLKFHDWIRQQLALEPEVTLNVQLSERVKRAAPHFAGEIQRMMAHLQACTVNTDNKNYAREVNERIKELYASLSVHQYLVSDFSVEIDLDMWQQKKRAFQAPSFSVNVFGGSAEVRKNLPHPSLYWQLKQLRDAISARKEQPLYLVASSKTLEELVNYLPQDDAELERISGFGKVKVGSYGGEFLEIIRSYCAENGLSSNMPEQKEKKRSKAEKPVSAKEEKASKEKSSSKKPDTKAESYRMFREGMKVADVASGRGLAVSTIEGHLAHYVQQGDIQIDELVSPAVVSLINDAIGRIETVSIGGLKSLVGDGASFGEIRFVLAWRNAQDS
ncbi:MAG: helix-turn-helix domain-containing protein [Chitinophagaceae bacterium]